MAAVLAVAAEEGRERQHRVDHDGLAGIVARNLEPHRAFGSPHIPTRDEAPANFRLLVDDRAQVVELVISDADHQVAAGLDAYLVRTFENKLDPTGVGAGCQLEVVFQAAVVAVPHEVDPGVDTGILDPRKVWNVRSPFRGIVSEEVVALPRLLVEPFRVARSRAGELDAQDSWRRRCRFRLQAEHEPRRGEEHAVAASSSDEVDTRISLSLVGLKAQRRLGVGAVPYPG